jgi:hypothetical protein
MKGKVIMVLLLFALTLSSCGPSKGIKNQTDSQVMKDQGKNVQEGSTDKVNGDTENSAWAKMNAAARGCKIYTQDETLKQDGLELTVNHAEITKKHGNWVDQDWEDDIKYDQDNNLTTEYSYFVVDVTIHSTKDQDKFWWSNIVLNEYKTGDKKMGPNILFSTDAITQQEMETNKSFFQTKLKKDQDIKVKLIYLVEDRYAKNKDQSWLMKYSIYGCTIDTLKPGDYSMIYLRDIERK